MRNTLRICSVLFLAFCFCLGTGSGLRAEQVQSRVKIGIILPLSGEAASWGEAVKNGMMLGYESLPQETRAKIELAYEDDQLQPKNTIAAFNKLLATGGLDAVINIASGTGKALAPIAEAKGITFISISTDPKVSQGTKHVFSFWVTPEEEARMLYPEAKKRGYHKVARIVSLHDGTLAAKAVIDKMNNGQIDYVLDDEPALDVKDFRVFISKIRARNDVDAILPILLPGQLGIFARQVRAMGLKQEFFGFETFEDSNEVKASEGALLGAWYINASDADGSFLKKYKERFPQASAYGASNGHDAILLLGRALEQGYNKSNFHQFLSTLKDFSGALGTYSATGDQRFTLPAALKVVTPNGFENLYQ